MRNLNPKIFALRLTALLILAVFAACSMFGCNYSRMRDDEAVEAYNDEFPKMPKKSIPVDGGIWIEREADPVSLVNPLPQTGEITGMGAERYKFYCVQCHGPRADGHGTVGQSFAPLPANLKEALVQNQSDGELFYKIRFGYKRHPALFSTMSNEETWALIRYIRTLAGRS